MRDLYKNQIKEYFFFYFSKYVKVLKDQTLTSLEDGLGFHKNM